MNNLIENALKANSTTILPDLGAFMQMGTTVLFNEFLKYDDGKLIQFISETKSIHADEAKTQLTEWISKLKTELEKGNSIEFNGLGTLVKNSGKLLFTYNSTAKDPITEETHSKAPILAEVKTLQNKNEDPKPIESVPLQIKEVKVVEELSSNLSAQDAIIKIKEFKSKTDLISFTRGESRKTVIDSLNKKLDELNGKISITSNIQTNEIKSPTVQKPIEQKVETEKVELKTPEEIVNPAKIEVKESISDPATEKNILKEEPKLVAPVVKPEVVKEEKIEPIITQTPEPVSIKEKVKELESIKKPLDDKAVAAIVASVDDTEKDIKKRKRNRIFLILAILFFLGGIGVTGYLKKDLILSWFEKEHKPKELAENPDKEDVAESKNNEEVKKDEIVPMEVIEPPIEEPLVKEEILNETVIEKTEQPESIVPVATSSNASYHIVAGSFTEEANALSKVEKLKENGNTGAKMIGKYGGLYTVVAASFESLESAKSALEAYKSNGNKGFVKKL